MNKDWHRFIYSNCDAQQYSLDAMTNEQSASLADLERAYRELYHEVFGRFEENAEPCGLPGCRHHVNEPCGYCGRLWSTPAPQPIMVERMDILANRTPPPPVQLPPDARLGDRILVGGRKYQVTSLTHRWANSYSHAVTTGTLSEVPD